MSAMEEAATNDSASTTAAGSSSSASHGALASASAGGALHDGLRDLLLAMDPRGAKQLLRDYAGRFATMAAFDAAKAGAYAVIAALERVTHAHLLLNDMHPRHKNYKANVAALLAANDLEPHDATPESEKYRAALARDTDDKARVQKRWKTLREKVAAEITARAGSASPAAAGAGSPAGGAGASVVAAGDGGGSSATGAASPLHTSAAGAGSRGRSKPMVGVKRRRKQRAEEEEGATDAGLEVAAAQTAASAGTRRRPLLSDALAGLVARRDELAAALTARAAPVSSGSSSTSALAASPPSSPARAPVDVWLSDPEGLAWGTRLSTVLSEVPASVHAAMEVAFGSRHHRQRPVRVMAAFALTCPVLLRVPFIADHLTQLKARPPYSAADEATHPRDAYQPRAGDFVIALTDGMTIGRFTPPAVRLRAAASRRACRCVREQREESASFLAHCARCACSLTVNFAGWLRGSHATRPNARRRQHGSDPSAPGRERCRVCYPRWHLQGVCAAADRPLARQRGGRIGRRQRIAIGRRWCRRVPYRLHAGVRDAARTRERRRDAVAERRHAAVQRGERQGGEGRSQSRDRC